MSATLQLTLRGLRRRGLGQVVALVAVCALAATAVVAGLAAQTSAADRADAAYERAGHPDLVLYGGADALEVAAGDEAVDAASDPLPLVGGLSTRVDDEAVDVEVMGLDPSSPPTVGAPDLVAGRWPEADEADTVVVEQSLVATGVTAVGETLTVEADSGPTELRVVGAAVDLTDCFWPSCDPLRVFAMPATFAALAPDGPSGYLAVYRLHDPDAAAATGGRLLGDPAAGIDGANNWPDTRGDILVIGTVFSSLVGGFGVFLLLAAAFVVAGATAARLVARRRSLGLLAATGFTPRQLLASVWAEHLILGGVGVLLGWALGTPAAPLFEAGLDDVLPGARAGFELHSLVVAALLVGVLLTLSVLGPAWRATHQAPSAVLRDVPATPEGGRRLARVARRLGAGPSTVCGLRRTFARPGRAALAGGALLVATAGAVVSFGFVGTLDSVAADPAVTGNPWDVAVEARTASTDDVTTVLDTTQGVGAWFTERERSGTVDGDGYTVRIVGGDPEAAGYVVQEGRPLRAADEAIVGYAFLDETGLAVGDDLEIELDGTVLDLHIVGWYSDTADGGKMIQIREEALPPAALVGLPTWRVVAGAGEDPDALATTLNERFGPAAAAEALTVDDLGPARGALLAMSVLLALVALANLVATSLSATRERARALGVLRTVGASTTQLVGQSAVGAAAVGLLAGVVGVPIGWVTYTALADGLTTGVGVGPGFAADPSILVAVAVVPAAALLAAGAGALATVRLARRPASELVRYE